MSPLPRRVGIFLLVFVLVNSTLVLIMRAADNVPVDLVKERIKEGFKDRNLSEIERPLRNFNRATMAHDIGVDHLSDCFIDLMALYRDTDRFKNAVAPGAYAKRTPRICALRKNVAEDAVEEDQLIIVRKPRLWHGSKALVLVLLTKFSYFEISEILKHVSYFLYGLIGVLLAAKSRDLGIAYIAVLFGGVTASGIHMHGGYSNAIPYIVALLGVVFILLDNPTVKNRAFFESMILVGASVHAFFYQLDGSLALFLMFAVLFGYFMVDEEVSYRKRIGNSIKICTVYLLGFSFSLLYKQWIAAIALPESHVWQKFWETVMLRTSGHYNGSSVAPLESIAKQFEYFHHFTFGSNLFASAVIVVGCFAWLAAIALALYRDKKNHSYEHSAGLSIFVLSASILFVRYGLLANHSYTHPHVVSRFLFLPFSLGAAALVWTALKKPKTVCR